MTGIDPYGPVEDIIRTIAVQSVAAQSMATELAHQVIDPDVPVAEGRKMAAAEYLALDLSAALAALVVALGRLKHESGDGYAAHVRDIAWVLSDDDLDLGGLADVRGAAHDETELSAARAAARGEIRRQFGLDPWGGEQA
jgi:hypothetical protein